MNAITLTVKISRENSSQCRVEFFREGEGDDLVANRADFMDSHIQKACDELLGLVGGEMIKREVGP